jgi:hypothetical protein
MRSPSSVTRLPSGTVPHIFRSPPFTLPRATQPGEEARPVLPDVLSFSSLNYIHLLHQVITDCSVEPLKTSTTTLPQSCQRWAAPAGDSL